MTEAAHRRVSGKSRDSPFLLGLRIPTLEWLTPWH